MLTDVVPVLMCFSVILNAIAITVCCALGVYNKKSNNAKIALFGEVGKDWHLATNARVCVHGELDRKKCINILADITA